MLINNGQRGSWLDRVLDKISPQAPPPPPPSPPPVDQTAWGESVDSHKVNELTVHDIGLIVFGETQSYANSDSANDTLSSAREKIAHAIMNADNKWGDRRNQMARTASPIEPSAKEVQNEGVRQAYQASLKAAREAYLSPTDPTNGATNLNFRTSPDPSNLKFR
jgi:hypothetical protein